jgi:hypothetical protein
LLSGNVLGNVLPVQAVNHVRIPFSKPTIWKKAIEKGTLDSCREVHEDMVLFLKLFGGFRKCVCCIWVLYVGRSEKTSALLDGFL